MFPKLFSKGKISASVNNSKNPDRGEKTNLDSSMNSLRGDRDSTDRNIVLFSHENNTTRITYNTRLDETVET